MKYYENDVYYACRLSNRRQRNDLMYRVRRMMIAYMCTLARLVHKARWRKNMFLLLSIKLGEVILNLNVINSLGKRSYYGLDKLMEDVHPIKQHQQQQQKTISVYRFINLGLYSPGSVGLNVKWSLLQSAGQALLPFSSKSAI